MLSNFIVVAGQVVTLFLLMGVGFVLARRGKLHTDGVVQMSYIALYMVTPCVIISQFEKQGGQATSLGAKLLQFAAIYGVATVINIVLSSLSFRQEPPTRRGPMRFAMCYGNNGFMGLPLLEAVLGPASMIYGAVSVIIFNFGIWTQGVHTMGGKVTPRQILLNPATVGFVVGLPLFLTGAQLPTTLSKAVGYMADLNTPLAMIIIGAQMAGADLKASFTSLRLYRATAFRLLLAPLFPLLLLLPLLPLGLDPMIYCAAVIICAVPVAGTTGMFAQRYEQDTAVAAQLVTLSTLLSVLTLPVLAVASRYLSGL